MLWIISRKIERMQHENKRNEWPIIAAHRQWDQNQTEKRSHAIDWLQKGPWYGPANLDKIMSENVQNIQQTYKHHHESH